MQNIRNKRSKLAGIGFACAFILIPGFLHAQDGNAEALPDSPGAVLASSSQGVSLDLSDQGGSAPNYASKFNRVIKDDQTARPLSGTDKLLLSFRSTFNFTALSGSLVSASWSHGWDSRPHYGTDKAGFGERLGASALKGATQSIFTYGIYDNVFHDDPHYYIMGRKKPIVRRALYAASRTFVTRKDNGNAAVNWPLFAGIASSGALANAYYPERDRTVQGTAVSFCNSIGSNMLSNEISEFLGDVVRIVRHK